MMRWPARVQAVCALAAAVPVFFLLRQFPPSRYSFYPACPIHAFLGVMCPGCGGTRAVAAILAGRWSEAVRDNALIVVLSPLAVIYAALLAYSAVRWDRWIAVRIPPMAFKLLFAMVMLFTFARDIDICPR
jgi:hypothetical protein